MWAKTTKVCDYDYYGTNISKGGQNTHRRSLSGVNIPSAPNHLKRKQFCGSANSEAETRISNHKLVQKPATGKEKAGKTESPPYCESVRLKGACHAAGGPHWRVQEAAHYGNAQQRGRKWHPPVGMHLLRAEMLVYMYAHIILDAVYWVEDALAERGVDVSKNTKSMSKKNRDSVSAIKLDILKGIYLIIEFLT